MIWDMYENGPCMKMALVDLIFQVTEVKMYDFIHFQSNNLRTNSHKMTKLSIWMHFEMMLDMHKNSTC